MLALKFIIAKFYQLRRYMQHIVDSYYPGKELATLQWQQVDFKAPIVFSDYVYHKHKIMAKPIPK